MPDMDQLPVLKAYPNNTPNRWPSSRCLPFLSGVLVLMGVIVIIGWALHEPSMTKLATEHGMPYSTAIGFVLTGLALMMADTGHNTGLFLSASGSLPPGWKNMLAMVFSGLLILLGAATLFEWLAGIHASSSPDLHGVWSWLGEENAKGGPMRPLAALAFIAVGLVIWLLPRTSRPIVAIFTHGLSLFVLLIGFFGVVGDWAGMDQILGWFVGPVLIAGIGFMTCGFGLLCLLQQHLAMQSTWGSQDGSKIGAVATTLIVTLSLGGIFGGFIVLYPPAISGVENELELSLKNRTDKLENAIQQGWRDSYSFANQPLRVAAMGKLDANPFDISQRNEVQKVAERYRAFGFSAVAFHTAGGGEVAHAGTFMIAPEFGVTVKTPVPSQLLWQRGYVLHSRVNMIDNGTVVGFLEAERQLNIGQELHITAPFGDTLDFAVCAWSPGGVDCFPFRSTKWKSLHNLSARYAGESIPVTYALKGKTGIVHAQDYRGVDVIAAYQPVGSLGLGAVLKIDAGELYEPIAQRLGPLMVMMMLVGTAGILMLRLQVMPMVRRMSREIEERKAAEERHRLVLENAADTILITNPEGGIVYANQQAVQLLGYSTAELYALSISDVMPPDETTMSQYLRRQIQEHGYLNFETKLEHRDGSVIPVEATAVRLPDGNVYGAYRDVTALKTYEDRLEYLANHDTLTGLANRHLLSDRLKQSIIHARRAGRWVAVAMLDIDRFKLANDSLGHDTGDELLREISQRLEAGVRPGDTVARLGGDKLMVILTDMSSETDVATLVGNLLSIVSLPVNVAGHEVILTSSIGVAIYPRDGDLAAQLYKNADTAMYRAKALGGNCFQFFASEMNAQLLERTLLDECMARIIASPVFINSVQLQKLLRYLVNESFTGNGIRLKGYSIGVEVFGRGMDFDPSSDAIVRVEVGRLRSKLKEYYASYGQYDTVRIHLPKGGYAVEFFQRNLVGSPGAAFHG